MSAKKPPRPYSERMATDPTKRRAHKAQIKREEAAARQVAYDALTRTEKLARLDPHGAQRQWKRLGRVA